MPLGEPGGWMVAGAAALSATLGASTGVGGAVLLVPLLLVMGLPATSAAAIGLLTVAAGAVAAAPRQVAQRLTNHRLAVSIEATASLGAIVGAWAAAQVSERVFVLLLASAVVVAALGGWSRTGMRNRPDPSLSAEDVGERPGTLGGAYQLGSQVVPYTTRRVPLGMSLSAGVGVLAGLTGTSGGYLKTPLMSEVMHVPAKVAAATSTLASGLTAVAALTVYVARGDVAIELSGAAIAGALLGGFVGARLQAVLPPVVARRALSVILLLIAVILVGFT